MTTEITNQIKLVSEKEFLEASLGENELAVIDTKEGRSHALTGTGARIWQLLAKPVTVTEIAECITAEYDIGLEECIAETHLFVADLYKNNLIKIAHGED